jgi:hypothetical protein
MNTRQPIDTAPEGDGWIMAYDPSLDPKDWPTAPWIIATRFDGGWCNEQGYAIAPTHWWPMPNPQPVGTGWRKAEGVIVIAPGNAPAVKWSGFLVCVERPDGSDDDAREWIMEDTLEGARTHAALEAEKLGLPVVERLDDATPDAPNAALDSSNNVVPIGTGKARR